MRWGELVHGCVRASVGGAGACALASAPLLTWHMLSSVLGYVPGGQDAPAQRFEGGCTRYACQWRGPAGTHELALA